MACWNALSYAQQERLIKIGNLPMGYQPAGDIAPAAKTCDRGAEVEIETMYDEAPGARFYCLPCAIDYLNSFKGV